MSNVVSLIDKQVTAQHWPASEVLRHAQAAGLEEVYVIGMRKDGTFFFAASESDGPNCVWALEQAKWRLFKKVDERTGEA